MTIILLPFLLAFGIGAGVISLLIGGIFLAVLGIRLCASYVAGGVLSIGIGFILTAIGLVGLVFAVWAGESDSQIFKVVYRLVSQNSPQGEKEW